jgi:hypothetical protein
MEIKVSLEAIEATTHCTKGFACLAGEAETICEVCKCVGGNVHFIDSSEMVHCCYKMSFGDRYLCRCPVRKELYNRYKL